MSNIKVGIFIKVLRKEKNLSQAELSTALFEKYDIDVTSIAISRWEKGNLPEIEKMCAIADYFNITIDELLEGERLNTTNYKEKYFITNPNWVQINNIEDGDIYKTYQGQLQKIISRFSNLIKKKINNDFTTNEESEFRFLFENFYLITDHALNIGEDASNDDYLKFKSALNAVIINFNTLSDEEIIFEIEKLYRPKNEIDLPFVRISDGYLNDESHLFHFNMLPLWEKDMLLCTIQEWDPIVSIPLTEQQHIAYKKRYGIEYEPEKITKSVIKTLIENGACLNKRFLQVLQNNTNQMRVIDRIEYLYNISKKPLTISVISDSSEPQTYYEVENTPKNRFLKEYYYQLKYFFKDISIDELYNLFINHESIDDREVIMILAKENNINTERSLSKIKIDLNIPTMGLNEIWNKIKDKEKEIFAAEEKINEYLSLLKNGVYYVNEVEIVMLKGESPEERCNIIISIKDKLTYKEYNSSRMKGLTQELLKCLDMLSLKEIRETFFKEEVITND